MKPPTPKTLKLYGWMILPSGVWISPSGGRYKTFEAAVKVFRQGRA